MGVYNNIKMEYDQSKTNVTESQQIKESMISDKKNVRLKKITMTEN